MSTATLPTRTLVGLLADLILTAGNDPELPVLSAVLLHSERGEWMVRQGDPAESALMDTVSSDLLVGTSTNMDMTAQAHTPTQGQLHRSVLVGVEDAKAIVALFKGRDVADTTVIELSGDILTITEDPDEAPKGRSLHVSVLDATEYPTEIATVLSPDPTLPVPDQDGVVIEPSYGTGLSPLHLLVVGAVGKRRKMEVAWYRHHQHRALVVEVGSAYRCVIQPRLLEEDLGQQLGPQVRVFTPPLPARKSDAGVSVRTVDDDVPW